jgi:signal peptidase II
MKIKSKLFFLFVCLVLIDQIFKVFLPATFCNKNIAWSIPTAPVIFYFVWAAIIAALLYMFFEIKNYPQKIFLALIFSGAVSNIIDRIRFGCVIDYVDLKFWPVFNLGDVYITVGIVFLIILNLKLKI